MSNVTEICLALMALLETDPEIDTASVDEYWPPVETQSIALLITPYRQRDLLEVKTAKPMVIFQSHLIHCEFWVKVDTGNLALTMKRAREVGQRAARRLLREDRQKVKLRDTVSAVGWYGVNAPSPRIEVQVHDRPVMANSVPFIVSDVTVGVIDFADALE